MSSSSSAPNRRESQTFASADVYQQLDRILADPLFLRSKGLSTFLRFIVERTLAGEAESLKEIVIGLEVFKRGATFDPQADNVVRVNANRLRSKLAEYYQTIGPADALIIDVPRGGYVPLFLSPKPGKQISSQSFRPLAFVKSSVGRQHELDRMRIDFASVSNGTGMMVIVSGDAGMGKTTFVEEFLSEIEDEPSTAWIGRGRCSESRAQTDAFAPILESLDELTRGESGEEAAQIMRASAPLWLSQVAPEKGDSAKDSATAIGVASHERMRRELIHFFHALSIIRPVIIFLDDLHWADASTCDILGYLGSRMKGIRILIATTSRTSELLTAKHPFQPVRLALEREGACHEIPLRLLSLSAIELYLRNCFPKNTFPTEFPAIVHERTEGNPLLMKDMLSFLRDRQILIEKEGHWLLDVELALIRRLIPDGAQNMIRLQIEQFSELDRSILRCAAVQGIEFDSVVISQVLSLEPGVVEDRLQVIERVHRFVNLTEEREYADRIFSVRYRFVHVFYQNALYADMVPTRRAAHSLAIARSLCGLTGETARAMAAEVAHFFQLGRDNESASQYFLHAARHAANVFAYPEALILCERGLGVLRSLPESRERDTRELGLSLTLGMSQMATCGFDAPEVEKTHLRSRELCLRVNDNRRLMQVLWGLHTCHVNAGELAPALELSREMRRLADLLADPASLAVSLHALGTTLAFIGNMVEARVSLEEIFIISPIDKHGFHSFLYVLDRCVTSLCMLARLLDLMGFLDEAVEKADMAVNLANQLGHPPSLAYATFWVGWIRHSRGEYTEACRSLEAAMDLSRASCLPQILEWGRMLRGSSLTHMGEVGEGISEMRRSLDNQMAMRCLVERPFCLTILAEALLLVSGYDEALALCDDALRIAQETLGRSYDAETHRIRGEVLLALNDAARASPDIEFQNAIHTAKKTNCRSLALRAAISHYRFKQKLGEGLEECASLAEAAEWFARRGNSPWIVEAWRLVRKQECGSDPGVKPPSSQAPSFAVG